MTPSRNKRIRELFDATVGQPPDVQAEVLWRECGDDEDLVREVWRLLGAKRKSDGFLAEPIWRARRIEASLGAPGSSIGPYTIVRELGSGGMGMVFQTVRADQVFRRVLALKVIRPDFVTDLLIAGFHQERRILGDLDHPNIARIVDAGSTEHGLPYFVMDYVDGSPIDRFCHDHKLSVVQRLSLFRQVCAATRYLHEHRIVHGDLKPSNILVNSEAAAKILDFGIARVLDQTGVPNPDGAMMPVVTPGYASPEQLRGEPPGFTSDVFSLGVVLYELLAGVKPHSQENRSVKDVATDVTTKDPSPPSVAVRTRPVTGIDKPMVLEKTLRGDLDCVVMKALSRETRTRYASVADFDADIERYISGRAVEARHGGPVYKVSRFVIRNRRALAVFLVVLALLAVTGWQALELRRDQKIREADETKLQILSKQAIDSLAQLSTAAASPASPATNVPLFGNVQMHDLRNLEEAYRVSFPEAIHIWPGLTPKRKQLLDQAHLYLHQAEPLVANDGQARRELAYAWQLVGDVQGNPHAPNLKDRAGAADSYGESERILEELLQGQKTQDADTLQMLDRVKSLAGAVQSGSN